MTYKERQSCIHTIQTLRRLALNIHGVIDVVDDANCNKLIELLNGGWIPVSERLPEDGQNVLFCDIDNDIMVGYHVKGRPDTHFSQDGTYDDMKDVRAWMPLPKPYKEEREEQS